MIVRHVLQVRQFMFDGREWESVEQCYQAMKFTKVEVQETWQQICTETVGYVCVFFGVRHMRRCLSFQ